MRLLYLILFAFIPLSVAAQTVDDEMKRRLNDRLAEMEMDAFTNGSPIKSERAPNTRWILSGRVALWNVYDEFEDGTDTQWTLRRSRIFSLKKNMKRLNITIQKRW